MRLDKFLCDMQIGTRSYVKDLIKKGQVSVNDTLIRKPDFQVNTACDLITCMGNTITYQNLYYYMLHKPSGVVTATRDKHVPTVMTLLSDACGKNLAPVGRLDKDTEGLLLITNDGELAHNLLSPNRHVPKTYYVECTGTLSADTVTLLENGVEIGDETPTRPAQVKVLTQLADFYTMELTITEGRFHQIKRMVQAVGGSVTYLKRLSMGTLLLDESLPKGSYRALTEQE
ncbi:MAG: 16S rRNA pseudouridine(516) synthase, partial [Lachnospiraceae bacterium]|nr:16S rRNA pseudouridine(516) synthase [Lachnospiraceae bacterium]